VHTQTVHRSPFLAETYQPLDPAKFRHPSVTAKGEQRAAVALERLDTLWFNTGTLCNLACLNCYIESSPTNDALAYLSAAEAASYLDEIAELGWSVREIGFTGGEPFMNPEAPAMIADALERGFETLVLTNAMRPMLRPRVKAALLALQARHGERLTIRVSLDHHTAAVHEAERGEGSWAGGLEGLAWLRDHGFRLAIAGRKLPEEPEDAARDAFARLFAELSLPVDAHDPGRLVIFPEMDARADVPEITEACWGILGKSPGEVMCASSRMVIKRRGAAGPTLTACTLLPYAPDFDLGPTLAGAAGPVPLNHPHCARFCVLGGASCSR
jgi:uncharacterized Fe-S cluster-containing radical SAM superfamily protein